jgi:hypothetical protein
MSNPYSPTKTYSTNARWQDARESIPSFQKPQEGHNHVSSAQNSTSLLKRGLSKIKQLLPGTSPTFYTPSFKS